MRTEDGYIIQQCLDGDAVAFGLLVEKYKKGIYALAYSRINNFHDAQDITQEVFIKAYQRLRTLRRWDNFMGWLYRITANQCKDWIRASSRRPDGAFAEDQEPYVVDRPAVDSYRDNMVYESVREALDSVPEIYREVMTLRYFGGMTVKEMASFLGVSPNTIDRRLKEARIRLKEEMIAMMNVTYEQHSLPASFTFRIVEATKRIKINPMPRMAGLPWGLTAAMGIIITVLSLNPHMSIPIDMANPGGSPLPVETGVLKTGEISVDILDVSQTPLLANMQGEDNGEKPDQQEIAAVAAQGQGGAWLPKADMLTTRALFSTCIVDGEIYAIGGEDDGFNPPLSNIEKYNPERNIWINVADMPASRFMHSSSVIDGKIYIIGGADIIFEKIEIYPVLVYDPAKNEWAEKGKTPVEFANHCSVVVNGKIYLIGGIDHSGNAVSRVFEYDPEVDKWTRKTNMPTARHWPTSGVVNGKIYVIGGGAPEWVWPDGRECHSLSTVEEYDPVIDKWTEREKMPTARTFASGCALDGKIYVIGGWLQKGLFTNKVEEYNPEMDMWKGVADMPTARGFSCSNAVNGRIYSTGGCEVVAYFSIAEEYTPEGWRTVSPQGKLPTKWGELKSD